jgi:hypothetical protein
MRAALGAATSKLCPPWKDCGKMARVGPPNDALVNMGPHHSYLHIIHYCYYSYVYQLSSRSWGPILQK